MKTSTADSPSLIHRRNRGKEELEKPLYCRMCAHTTYQARSALSPPNSVIRRIVFWFTEVTIEGVVFQIFCIVFLP
jgi:hypothetical protein